MECAILRTQKLAACDVLRSWHVDITQVFCADAIQRIETAMKNILSAMAEGDELGALLTAQPQSTNLPPANTIAARLRIAKTLVEANGWTY